MYLYVADRKASAFVTLPETNMFAENGWLEDDPFLWGWFIFRAKLGKLLVSGSVLDSSLL